tara:strand:+ start:303 stop:494 length:192 start_codon:yes stop_codon:yes gene_type:complete
MDHKKKMLIMMGCILGVYLIAIVIGIAFLVFLATSEWIKAGVVLFIELCLFFIGRTLRKQLWQ